MAWRANDQTRSSRPWPGCTRLDVGLPRAATIDRADGGEGAVDRLAVGVDQPEDAVDLLGAVGRPGVDGPAQDPAVRAPDHLPHRAEPLRSVGRAHATRRELRDQQRHVPALARPGGQDLGEARRVGVDAVDEPRSAPAGLESVAQPGQVGVLGVAVDDRVVRIGRADLVDQLDVKRREVAGTLLPGRVGADRHPGRVDQLVEHLVADRPHPEGRVVAVPCDPGQHVGGDPLADGRVGVVGLGVELERRRHAEAVTLGGVEQQRVELARLPAEDGVDAGLLQRGEVAVEEAGALVVRQAAGSARCSRCPG